VPAAPTAGLEPAESEPEESEHLVTGKKYGMFEYRLPDCDKHGGEPDSVYFWEEVGLGCVSCLPFRVPVARLGAGRTDIVGTSAEVFAVSQQRVPMGAVQ
jgi:hypothetical protein